MRRGPGKRSRKNVRTIYNFDIVVMMVIVMMMTMGKMMMMMITVNDDVDEDELMRMIISFDDYKEGILC